jgi:hypothetical protein
MLDDLSGVPCAAKRRRRRSGGLILRGRSGTLRTEQNVSVSMDSRQLLSSAKRSGLLFVSGVAAITVLSGMSFAHLAGAVGPYRTCEGSPPSSTCPSLPPPPPGLHDAHEDSAHPTIPYPNPSSQPPPSGYWYTY